MMIKINCGGRGYYRYAFSFLFLYTTQLTISNIVNSHSASKGSQPKTLAVEYIIVIEFVPR